MSTLNDLLRRLDRLDPDLAEGLRHEVQALNSRRAFGLNFERHQPEAVELPGRPVRTGDKVRILPERGSTKKGDQTLCRVTRIETIDGHRVAHLALADEGGTLPADSALCDDLVVVAEFADPIYPGLVETGRVERGGDKPFHTVINAENFHALEALLYTHEGKVDAIYLDPPYNTGAKDWKYNNDYVGEDDDYRHSKWLAFMERRLTLAKRLLNPDDSVLIVTIDEKEYLRLGLLLEQTFPEADIQMVTSIINRSGSPRSGRFSRVEEYVYFVFVGSATAKGWTRTMLNDEEPEAEATMPTVWFAAVRTGSPSALRGARPNLFYPLFVEAETGAFVAVGECIEKDVDYRSVPTPDGLLAIWPVHSDGTEQTWRFSSSAMRRHFTNGTARLGRRDAITGLRPVTYLRPGTIANIEKGVFRVLGRTSEGAVEVGLGSGSRAVTPRTVWSMTSHYARDHGSYVLGSLFGDGRKFPYPKALYAVEDTLRFYVSGKPDATVIDFFSGSGTTAHAVMRLNRQDGGRRQCISVTNNEVGADEQAKLRKQGLRPGDPDWERWGICDYITKPRIEAAITGQTPDGVPIKGEYKFTDEFPMAEGFEENAAFFTLTYETPRRVAYHRAFDAIAPMLWLKAGSRGRIIKDVDKGFDVSDVYAVIADLDKAPAVLDQLTEAHRMVFIVTDDDRRFQMLVRDLPPHVEPVRLYESYLRNFEINTGRE